jgi:predicted RNA binding protein YcfA (HicA-like mRNA interferase family)
MAESCAELLRRARSAGKSIKFDELVKLAGCFGYSFDRQKGSHHIFTRPGSYPINIQPRHGDSKMAKPVQVKQVIDFIDSQKEK